MQIQNVGHRRRQSLQRLAGGGRRPPLMVLDAEVELSSAAGARMLALSRLHPRQPQDGAAAGRDGHRDPCAQGPTAGASAFEKLGARRYLVISIAMVAARVVVAEDGRVAKAAVAVGSCSAVAQRLPALEAALVGLQAGPGSRNAVEAAGLERTRADRRRARQRRLSRAAAREIVCARDLARSAVVAEIAA